MYSQLGSGCEGILWSDSQPVAEERERGRKKKARKREGEIAHLTGCPKLFSVAQLCVQERLYTLNTFF